MCGIAGVFDLKGRKCPGEALGAMQMALSHRGPDDAGCFKDGPVGLAFQRLSILDIEGGHQPMTSPDGRFTIVFNGEIYNHEELRPGLQSQGWRFSTRSDTETLLAGFALHGADFFGKLNGMFACAVWDSAARILTLARDPLGIKPLYISRQNNRLYFSSELKSLLATDIACSLEPTAVFDYLAYGYVHAPATVIAGVEKFPPGHWLAVSESKVSQPIRYWNLPDPADVRFDVDEREVQEELAGLLARVVRDQMMSDVPVGVFLSGGIDSSIVTAFMTRATQQPVESYSVGFDGVESVDETSYAEAVSRHLGTRHETIRLPAGVLDDIPRMIACLDEPVADAAILPTWYLSTLARKRVKVVLTGEGGDELFGGYGRHKAASVTEALGRFPAWLRPAVLPAARRLGQGAYFKALPVEDPLSWALAEAGPRLKSAREILPPEVAAAPFAPWLERYSSLTGLNGMLAFDLQTSMADQLLMKVDKTTMRASLEARVPLLDLRLVDFMFRLPPSLKVKFFRGKVLLRRIAQDILPPRIARRRKHGFILRCQKWMRSPANALCAEALTDSVLPETGLFQRSQLAKALENLRSGSPKADPEFYFRVLVFALWLKDVQPGVHRPAHRQPASLEP